MKDEWKNKFNSKAGLINHEILEPHERKSGGGPPQSKTLREFQWHTNGAKRLGVRQSSGALRGNDDGRMTNGKTNLRGVKWIAGASE
jgi:hypothetical protein